MGEFEMLARLRQRLPPPGPRVLIGSGDDAAVTVPGGATATSVDAMVEGVHFRREWSTLAQIGRKALATALSDLAAMGALTGEAYAVVGVPPDLDEDGCLELFGGIAGLAGETGTALVGGDVTRAPALTLAITVVGHAPSAEQLVGRGGAKPGDVLVVTGELGGAAAGLLLLERPELAASVDEQTAQRLRQRLLDPAARLASGRGLAAASAGAMIDLSDGLGGDAVHLAAASGVGLRVDAGTLPLASGVAAVAAAAGRDPLELALSGGEDYELLAALPPQWVTEGLARIGEARETKLTPIGEVHAGEGVEIRLPGGETADPVGFDQLG
jgi:thiamine-monophosphate kinase